MDTKRELYSRQDIKRLEKTSKRAALAALLIAAATLLLCVLFCCLTDIDRAAAMEKAAVLCSIVGGWIVIYLRNWPVKELRAECGHAQMLLEGERETIEGVLALSKQRMRIRGSIRFYPLTLTDGNETRRSKVIASRAEVLRAMEGKRLRLYAVNGYVAAWEEL
jgi:hypothetical protein